MYNLIRNKLLNIETYKTAQFSDLIEGIWIAENKDKIIGETRTSGDGYYESVIEDIEGNWVEITK